jgi:hypothetical protein
MTGRIRVGRIERVDGVRFAQVEIRDDKVVRM